MNENIRCPKCGEKMVWLVRECKDCGDTQYKARCECGFELRPLSDEEYAKIPADVLETIRNNIS